MKLDIMTLDLVEAAAAVAHAASGQLYGMLNETDGYDWAGTGLEGDELASAIYYFARYCHTHKAHGEQLWLKMRMEGVLQDGVPESRVFSDVEPARKWAFGLFGEVFRSVYDQMMVVRRWTEQQQREENRPANPAPAIEDTIFEPIGSMGEMDPHARAFLADLAKPKAPARAEDPQPVIEPGAPDPAGQQMSAGAKSDERLAGENSDPAKIPGQNQDQETGNAEDPANQQPENSGETGTETGAAPQAQTVVPGDGDPAPAGDGNGQPAGANGAAGGTDAGAKTEAPKTDEGGNGYSAAGDDSGGSGSAAAAVKKPERTRKTGSKAKSRRKPAQK